MTSTAPTAARAADGASAPRTLAEATALTRSPDFAGNGDGRFGDFGGGSNAMGAFAAHLEDEEVRLIGVEPGGTGDAPGAHAATMTFGSPGTLHGMETLMLQDGAGEPGEVHSIASGLDYPGVGPQHVHLHQLGRVEYVRENDEAVLDAFRLLSRTEGIIPALESAHALARAIRLAPTMGREEHLLVNLSGRGDKDIDYVAERIGMTGEADAFVR